MYKASLDPRTIKYNGKMFHGNVCCGGDGYVMLRLYTQILLGYPSLDAELGYRKPYQGPVTTYSKLVRLLALAEMALNSPVNE